MSLRSYNFASIVRQISDWWKAVRKYFELKAESFPKISHKCLTFLLEDDSLDVAEIDLFLAVCFPLYDKAETI